MTQLSEAVARYHKILESDPYKDMAWAEMLRSRMAGSGLVVSARPVCPVLRPHFLSSRQYAHMAKATETLFCAIDRVREMTLSNPALMARMEMLPAEKMLASIDPGYSYFSVASLLDTSLNNGSVHVLDYASDNSLGIAYGEVLTNLFLETGPLKEFRKKYTLTKMAGPKVLLHGMLKAYKEYGGKKQPNIAIVEMKQPFQTAESAEYSLLAESFRKLGYAAEVINIDQLEYKNGILRRGDYTVDLVYRCIRLQEFLVRYDLSNALVRAYRDRAVCMVNSFRAELARKKAIYHLLTDDSVTQGFPAAERKAIRESIPWTRVVAAANTSYQDQQIDLIDFIQRNREKLVLRPNDSGGEYHEYRGWETDDAGWERALRTALRNAYVVQEKIEPSAAVFPVMQWSSVEMKTLKVDVQPHTFLGKVQGCTTYISSVESNRFSTLNGVVPTFVLEGK